MKPIVPQDQISDFILYTTPNGEIKVEVMLKGETIWMSQKKMAELFGVDVRTVNEHIQNIYKSLELEENSTIRKNQIVQKEWEREVSREVNFYNLDIIIAVGYRVNSRQATNFRIRATKILREYTIKGFAMDDNRLKNGDYFGKDYFQELLERVRSIRASERRIRLQITDIFAECSIDYDPNAEITQEFYSSIQNKFHYAITGQTGAEIVYHLADHTKPKMWLTTFKNSPDGRVIKTDTTIAKNYLPETQIKKLERLVSSFFDYIENIIENHTTFTMEDFTSSVNKFLEFNEYKVLDGKWSISHKQAENKAHSEYDIFNKTQAINSDFEKMVKRLTEKNK